MNRCMRAMVIATVGLVQVAAGASVPMEIATNFWDIRWGGSDPFKAGYQNVTGDNPWRQDFLDEIRIYTCLRYMDFNQVNWAERSHTGRWADRVQKSAKVQAPVAYEWQIDLCNRAKADLWICIPHNADQTYWRELANLVYRTLDPSLRCYVEHSNETWNDMFSQAAYCKQKGAEVGIQASNEWYRGQKYHAYVSYRIFAVFEEVFKDARHRLVNVMGSTDGHAFAEDQLAAASDPFYNPGKARLDAIAVAPYFGSGLNGSTDAVFAQLYAAIDDRSARCRQIQAKARAIGAELICYEGGQHLLSGANIANAKPQMYDVYMAYMDSMSSIFPLFAHYCHSGRWGDGGAWGSKQEVGESMTVAHKYRALYDYTIRSGQYTVGASSSRRIRTATMFTPLPSAARPAAGDRPSVQPARSRSAFTLSGALVAGNAPARRAGVIAAFSGPSLSIIRP